MTEHAAAPSQFVADAGLHLRLAAMIYDALLLFGVVFTVSYALLALTRWSYPLPPIQRTVLQLALFVAIGAYFVICWTRTGQTLALKAWRLKVVDNNGQPPGSARATARYLLAWHLWLPGLAIAALFQTSAAGAIAALAVSAGLLFATALFDRQRRLLHDRWTGTRVVRVPS